MPDYIVIATWAFGETAVKVAAPLLAQGKPALDAVIAGAQAVEDDPEVNSVGYGGLPNAIGTVSLDACVMDGKTLNCGAVAGVENIRHPAALARRVMEKTPHVLLVGTGAQQFGMREGFPLECLQTPESLASWMKDKPKPLGGKENQISHIDPGLPLRSHDTVTVLALDKSGSLGGVCTTSGLANKLPGRVGDSPIIGAGLYVDNEAGAAGATGVGEEIIRIGGSLILVEAMRAGKSPQEACELAIQRINKTALRRGVHPAGVAFLALDPKGRWGAACTPRTGFRVAIATPGKIELIKAKEVAPQQD